MTFGAVLKKYRRDVPVKRYRKLWRLLSESSKGAESCRQQSD
jgi:hypothetical protein